MKKKISLIVFIAFGLIYLPLNAQTWNAARRLTWSPNQSNNPVIATGASSDIHIVWHDYAPGNSEIFYRNSTDAGGTWSGIKRLTWNPDASLMPDIAIDSSGHIHVVWQNYTPGNVEIFYKKSTDGGGTWLGTKRLTWTSGGSYGPAVGTDSSNNVHVVWHDYTPGNSEIFYKKSTDGGGTWLGAKRLIWNSESSLDSSIAIDSDADIHIVWEDYALGNNEIFYKRSTDGGSSWSGMRRLTWTSGDSYYASIVVSLGNHLHVVWYDDTPGNYEVYYKNSTNGGTSWSASKRLTWTSASSYIPDIDADSSNNIHVLWCDEVPGNWEVYYRRSTNGGMNWSGGTRLTWNSGGSLYPVVGTDSANNIHLVWHDNTPGNFEVYYKKGIQ